MDAKSDHKPFQLCCIGWSTRQRGGVGGVLYAVRTGVADRVRVCTRPTVHCSGSTSTRLL